MRRVALLLLSASFALTLTSLVPVSEQAAVAAAAAAPGQPNIIIITTDDQRVGSLQTMPTVRKKLRALGADYLGVVPTSICCPSRVSLLTGNLAHTTDVYTNSLDFGGWPTFNASGFENETFAVALQEAGYRTGLFGKYLNYWNQAPEGFVPPGWDSFEAIYEPEGQGAASYYDYELRGTTEPISFGSDPHDYSTNVIKRRAVDYIESVPPGRPYLAYIAVAAPHAPYIPAVQDIGSYEPKNPYNNPGVNEEDLTDKPSFMQRLKPVDPAVITRAQVGTGESLRAVDRLVKSVVAAADMSNTLVIFTSDNGVMWGDHRLEHKYRAYRWATEVPMIMRWDGVIAPGTEGMAANIDVTPTVLEAAGIPDALSMEGTSVLDGTRERVLIEGVARGKRPAYCGMRTSQYLFVQHGNGERELYDYESDPFELQNRADDPSFAEVAADLRKRTKNQCSPPPPDFTWNP